MTDHIHKSHKTWVYDHQAFRGTKTAARSILDNFLATFSGSLTRPLLAMSCSMLPHCLSTAYQQAEPCFDLHGCLSQHSNIVANCARCLICLRS
jgi:hypothetical protein